MVVDPGEEKVPAEDIQAQTIHLNMVHGADLGVKRNILPRAHRHKRGKVSKTRVLQTNIQSSEAVQKKDISKSNTDKKSISFANGNRRQTTQRHLQHSPLASTKRTAMKQHDTNASKKSNVNEKEMRVQGQSGHLHVHTDHNITAVDSRSGKLEIYIKNPDHQFDAEEHAAEHHSKVSVEVIASEAYKKNHLMTKATSLPAPALNSKHSTSLLHLADVTGFKKSQVIFSSKRSRKHHKHRNHKENY